MTVPAAMSEPVKTTTLSGDFMLFPERPPAWRRPRKASASSTRPKQRAREAVNFGFALEIVVGNDLGGMDHGDPHRRCVAPQLLETGPHFGPALERGAEPQDPRGDSRQAAQPPSPLGAKALAQRRACGWAQRPRPPATPATRPWLSARGSRARGKRERLLKPR